MLVSFDVLLQRYLVQTGVQHNDHLIPIETSDDNIINSSLQLLKSRFRILILSNDRNLQIKATANSFDNCAAEDFEAKIRSKRIKTNNFHVIFIHSNDLI